MLVLYALLSVTPFFGFVTGRSGLEQPNAGRLHEAIQGLVEQAGTISIFFVSGRLLDVNPVIDVAVQKRRLDVHLLDLVVHGSGDREQGLVAHRLDD